MRAQGTPPGPEVPRVAAVQLEMRGGGAVPPEVSGLLAVQPGQPLSVRAIRRSIERLFSTGRFADVVALGREGPDGLVVVFQLAPSVRIGRVEVTGAGALGKDEVLAAARLAPGSEFWPERLVDARTGLIAAYARRGWNAAQVDATSEPASGNEVVVRLDIHPGEPTRVTALRFDGQAGLSLQRLARAFGLRVGDILDRTRLDPGAEAVRTLYRETHHARARVGSPRVSIEGTAAVVSVPVDAGPRFTFRFEGNRRYPSAWLGGALEIDPAETLDRSVLEREARRVEAFYRYRGFRDVRVEPSEVQNRDGTRAVVVFHVVEGRQSLVRSVQFEGRSGLPEEDLRTILERVIRERIPEPGEQRLEWDPLQPESRLVTAGRPDTPGPPPAAVFVEEAWRDAAEAMQRAYRELGWVDAKVALASAVDDVDASAVDVRFRLEEGVRTFVRSVRFQGLPPGFPPPAVPSLRPGLPFSQTRLDEALATTLRDLGRASYLFAQVSAQADISTDRTAANPILIIDPGPAVRVGQVVLRGLSRTDESLVRANLKLGPGQPLDPEALFESQRELLLLGLFRTVSVRLISPDTPEPVKDVVVEARERPRLSGSVGLGYSLEDGPRIIGDLVYPNLFGQGINFTFRGKLNYVGLSALPLQDYVNGSELQGLNGLDFNINAGLTQPRIWQFLPAQVGVRLTFTAERIHRPTYFYGRVAGLFGVDWAITRWLRLTGSYLIENVLVRAQAGVEELLAPTRQTDAERLRFPTGNFFLQTVGTGLTFDFRDEPANPRSGLLINTSGEVTKDFSAETTDVNGNNPVPANIFTFKASFGITGYIPLPSRAVLALSLQGGKIFPLITNSLIIPPKRFFMGGATTLRGFRIDALIPQDFRGVYAFERRACEALAWSGGCTSRALVLTGGGTLPSEGGTIFELAKIELRLPLVSDFELGLFFEAGNLWYEERRYKPFDLRPVAGLGVRYVTPVGPLALDVGFNLDPDEALNEPIFAVQFSVGVF